MEILPHLWIQNYNQLDKKLIYIKKIKYIIHLSKYEPYIKKDNLEELKIPIDYSDEQSYEEQNIVMYQSLFDITEFIHDKIINNKNILLLGYHDKQDIEIILVSYFIRYGKLNIHDSILFLKSKKDDIFEPKCLFYFALNKFYYEFNKI
jgi:hypothetical protein